MYYMQLIIFTTPQCDTSLLLYILNRLMSLFFFIVIRFIGVFGNTTAWPTSSLLQNAFDLMQPPIISMQRSKHFTFLFKFYIYISLFIYIYMYSNFTD